MSSNAALQPEVAPIVACTISRDVQNFDLLIEDMETELGESWGDLSFDDARVFLGQPDAADLEFVAIAIDQDDEDKLAVIADLIKTSVASKIKVIVVAEDVSPAALHQLLKLGAEEFIPYPLPDGALHDTIERLRRPEVAVQENVVRARKSGENKNGAVFAIHGLAGGIGATTLAVNLAWELAKVDKDSNHNVCLLDFDLQFGSVSTFLDLPRKEAVFELLSDTETMDADSFMQALANYDENLSVLTAPSEMLPLDMLGPEDVERILEAARANFDYVIIDMPTCVTMWTEVVLHAAHVYFTPLEIDMRSAQNTLRMIRALKSEELPVEKLRYVMNRAPKFTDMSGKARVKRLAESLDIDIELMLPDGGRQVIEATDQGEPLANVAAKNPYRKEIAKLAKQLHELNVAEDVG